MKKTLLSIGLLTCLTAFGQLPPYAPTTNLRAFFPCEGNLQNANMSQAGLYYLAPAFAGNDFSNFGNSYSNNNQAFNVSSSSAYKSDNLTQNMTNFTVSAYVYLENYPDSYQLFSTIASDLMFTYDYQQNLVGTAGFFTLRVNQQGNVQGVLIGGGQSPVYSVATSGASLGLNTWYHIALSADFTNQTLKLYIDGEVDGEVTGSLVVANPATKFLVGSVQRMEQDSQGNIFAAIGQQWNGRIDELAVYQSALSQCDIQALGQQLPAIDPVISVNNDNTALQTTNSPDLTYQWYNCATDQAISGATSAAFTPGNTDEYYVVISNSCQTDTSACLALSASTNGIDESSLALLTLVPNPANSVFTVEGVQVEKLILTDAHGRIVLTATGNSCQTDALQNGWYHLLIHTTEGAILSRRLVISH